MTISQITSRSRQNQDQNVKVFSSQVKMMGSSISVYCYLVDGVLIDSGPHRMERGILEFCLRHQPDKIVHTHYHEDHTGNTAYLMAKLQVPAYIHPKSLPICQVKGQIPFYRLAFWGNRRNFAAEALPDFVENQRSGLEVIHTPGHTSDHVVFLDNKEGRLFSGDLFLHHKTRIVRRNENIPRIMNSLRLLLKKNFDTVYCAHAGIVKDGYRFVEKKLHHLEILQEQILSLAQQGLDIQEITRRLFPQKPAITYFSFGQFSSYHLVRSMIEDSSNP